MIYEVGRVYRVPHVFGQLGCMRPLWWPVMGSLHEDKEVIGFPQPHYHIDWRFVPKGQLYYPMPASNYAFPLQMGGGLNDDGFCEPVLRRRKCHRQHEHPYNRIAITWMRKLEDAHAGCKLVDGKVCPHRGYDLSGEQPDENGVVTCPMHGLRWNIFTGELAPRNSPLAKFSK